LLYFGLRKQLVDVGKCQVLWRMPVTFCLSFLLAKLDENGTCKRALQLGKMSNCVTLFFGVYYTTFWSFSKIFCENRFEIVGRIIHICLKEPKRCFARKN
jgi:hypothetical protein